MRVRAVTAALWGLSMVLVAHRPIPAQETRARESSRAPVPKLNDGKDAVSSAVDQLVEQLRRHPPQPSKAADRVAGLYMIEVATGLVTLIADQPEADLTNCGSPGWSNDGKRILFDASRPDVVQRALLKTIQLVDGRLTVTDLGVGNCPTFSPGNDQIAFLLNPGAVPNAQPGIWLMQADGSVRRRLGSYGRPKWSLDKRQLMIIGFANPADVTPRDFDLQNSSQVQIPGLQFYSVPNWVSDGTIVAAVGSDFGDSIALIDVTNPAQAKVRKVLWKADFKGKGPDVQPLNPVYMPSTRRCVFVGKANEGMAIYSLEHGRANLPKRLEPEGFDSLLQDLALSPDGRYVLFSSNRTGPRQRGSEARDLDPRPKEGADR
jgi:Tol biopolymer transport system component